ncbi:MAG: hypothetical protein K4305_09035 [Chlorobium sp.]|uniref:hypothetical protein n=1 Tax=Chlorobium sp. TaxID=1095 RepID=UPI002F415151
MATPLLAYSQFFDANGNPLSGGKVHTYEAGTTFQRVTYTDESRVTENSNPVILDEAGKAAIYLDGCYKIVVTDADDVPVWVKDDVRSIGQDEWLGEYPATMEGAASVSVVGNVTSVFSAKRAVKISDASTVYGHVVSSSYVGGVTTISLSLSFSLTAAVSGIAAGVVSSDSLPSIDSQVVVFGGIQTAGRGASGFVVTGLTGGTDDNLDGIDGATGGPNGGSLLDHDVAICLHGDQTVTIHELDADSGEVETSPNVIEPNSNPGTKRWKMRFFKWLKAAVNVGGFWNSGDFLNADGDLVCQADAKGIVFSDGTKITRQAGGGLRIIPKSDAYPVIVRNAANDADVFIAKPPSNADALTGTSTTEPVTPANLDYVLVNRVGTANAPDVKTALNASGSAPIYACRAWVVFNGTGTVSIRGSANVSSVTDRGAGQYRVNFTTPMANVNFSGLITPGGATGVSGSRGYEDGQARTTSYWEFITAHYNGSSTDCAWANVIIFN